MCRDETKQAKFEGIRSTHRLMTFCWACCWDIVSGRSTRPNMVDGSAGVVYLELCLATSLVGRTRYLRTSRIGGRWKSRRCLCSAERRRATRSV